MVQLQCRGVEHAAAPRGPVARHPVDVQTAQAVWTVIPNRPSTGGHVQPAVYTGEGFIHVDGVRSDLRRARSIEKGPYQTLSGQSAVESPTSRLSLERRQQDRIPVDVLPQPLDLAPGANPCEARERI